MLLPCRCVVCDQLGKRKKGKVCCVWLVGKNPQLGCGEKEKKRGKIKNQTPAQRTQKKKIAGSA